MITNQQIQNIRTLCNYIKTLPKNYKHLDMRWFARNDDAYRTYDPDEFGPDLLNHCGTVACLVGHGPAAGIDPEKQTSWWGYAEEKFGSDHAVIDKDDEFVTVFDRIFHDRLSSDLDDCINRMETLLVELEEG